MITIKSKSSLAKMEKAGELLSNVLRDVSFFVNSGVSTLEIDTWIEKELRSKGLVPRAKGYKGYMHASCISVNEAVIHGVPSAGIILKNGDLVKIDVVASWKGYCADMARSFFVGSAASPEISFFVEVAQKALDKGIGMALAGNHLSDISFAIQNEVEKNGFGIVKDFAGHGIGKYVHEEPEIPNYGIPGKGPVLQSGMVLAIEPMISMGSGDIEIIRDGWTVQTKDKSLTAHVEDTVVVTNGSPKILTRCAIQEGGKNI